MRGRYILVVTLLLSVADTFGIVPRHCGLSPNPGSIIPDTAVVATVNGEPLAYGEFMLFFRLLKPRVISELRNKSGAEYSPEFWSTDMGGVTPLGILKKRTMDTLVQVKIQQICAYHAGIVHDIGYREFLNALATENQRRLSAKKAGTVIYGPVQYSKEVYYNYLFSNAVSRLKEHLAGVEFGLTEEKLRETYEKVKDSLFRSGYHTVATAMEIQPAGANGKDGGPISVTGIATTFVFNDSVYSPEEENGLRQIVKETAGKLSVEQFTEAAGPHGTRYMVKVVEKVPLGPRSFARCRTAVRILMLDQLYCQYVDTLVKKAQCVTMENIYQKIEN